MSGTTENAVDFARPLARTCCNLQGQSAVADQRENSEQIVAQAPDVIVATGK